MHPFETYLTDLLEIRSSGAAVKELSYYAPLANLLNAVGKTLKPKVRAVQNLQNIGAGIPDFGLFTGEQFQRASDAEPLPDIVPARGVGEVKGLKEDLDTLVKSDQVARYLQKYGLVLATNYREFVLVGPGPHGRPQALESCRLADSEAEFWKLARRPRKSTDLHGERLVEFLKRAMTHNATITDPKDAAWILASYAREARARLEAAGNPPALGELRKAFEKALRIEFRDEKAKHFFRSTLVQTLFYGMFSAWVLKHDEAQDTGIGAKEVFEWNDTAQLLHLPVLQALFQTFSNPAKLKPLGLIEVLDWAEAALNRVNQDAFFSKFDERQAVQYFYEPFLEAYDPELRKDLGVWYTPPEIVQYMVARVDAVLKSELDIPDGLADPNVYVLDPACGTAAYPLEVLRVIAKTLKERGEDGLAAYELKRAAMTRVFGFEILPAPFVIAHLQIGLFLHKQDAALSEDERAGVYLTNSLTGWEPSKEPRQLSLFFELEEEREKAERVKQHTPILVILGNPPYNAFAGVAQTEAEKDQIAVYKEGLISEWGIKKFNLDDLYVRFFRLAEHRIAEHTGKGVVCFISNYSWLEGSSFVVLRQHLLKQFNQFWIDNMHGDRKISEYAPDGRTSETVFAIQGFSPGIQQGVAISLWIKNGKNYKNRVLFRDDLDQAKADDRRAALLNSVADPDFTSHYQVVQPKAETKYSFRHSDQSGEYLNWPKLVDLCLDDPSNGLMEKRGGALMDTRREALEQRMRLYYDADVPWEELQALKTGLTEDAAGFEAKKVRAKVQAAEPFQSENIRRYALRPFDNRWCYYSEVSPLWNRARPTLWAQSWTGNQFLLTRFQRSKDPEGSPFFYTCLLSDDHFLSPDAVAIPFRLRRTAPKGSKKVDQIALFEDKRIIANLDRFTIGYLHHLEFDDIGGPVPPDGTINGYELIWLHALAIGYSPAYLTENADGIRQDWPRIPLPDSREALIASALLGRQVAALLDIETPLAGVTTGAIRAELKPIGGLVKTGGSSIHPEAGDLAVEAGWGHAGKEGVTMPGRGKAVERAPQPGEWSGPKTLDVYLNAAVCWRNIPAEVWDYTIGGYQVIKKWLSYREKSVLGRDLLVEEARYVTEMARRIAALVLLQAELDANYRRVTGNVYQWGQRAVQPRTKGDYPVRVETYPAGYSLGDRFPNRRMVAGVEGGGVDFAEKDGHFYVIFDEGTLADFLDEGNDADVIKQLISVFEFDTEADRQRFVKEKDRGWYWLKS